MKHTLTIAAREIRDMSFLFIAAAVLALIPFIAFLPLRSGGNALEAVAIFGFVVASNFAIVVAIMLGASMIGRELTERRLSFYFSRPLPGASIWFGKLTAALLMTVIAYVIIAVPAALVSSKAWQSTWPISPVRSIGIAAVIGLLIILLAHTVSTGVRSRSPLVFVDLVAIGLTSVVVWLIIRPLTDAMAVDVLMSYALAFAIGVGVILIAGGAWQMASGRIDAKRNHFELSKFVWAAMAMFLVTLALFTAWFVRVDVSNLVKISGGVQAPKGPWTLLTGNYRGRADYRPVLLYDMQHGRSMRMDGPVELSNDGRSVIWTRQMGLVPGRREICITSLGDKPSTMATGIAVSPKEDFILSDDHRQVAVLQGKLLSVHDLSGPRLIGSVRIPLQNAAMYFVGPSRIRLISRWAPGAPASAGPEGIYVAEFDAGSKSVANTGRLDLGESRALFGANADGSRLLVNHWDPKQKWANREVLLLDARSAAVIANLGQAGRGFAARFLSDGRIVTAGSVDGRVAVHLFSADGVHLRDIDAGKADAAYGPVVIAPNRIALLETVTLADQSRKATIAIVDLERGVVASLPDLWPAEGYNLAYYKNDPRLFTAEPNRPLLLTDRKSTLWKWDPATGQKTKIVGE